MLECQQVQTILELTTIMTAQTIHSEDLCTCWRDILDPASSGSDTVIIHDGKPVAVVVPFEDYAALRDEFADLRAGRRAQIVLDAWRQDPSCARPYEDIRAELVAKGLLSKA